MRLQRVLVRRGADGKPFYKWQVTLPPDVVDSLGWQPGEELSATAEDDALVIRRANNA